MNKHDLIQAIQGGAQWLISTTGESPLSLAFQNQQHDIANCLVKRIPKYLFPNFPFQGISFNQLNRLSLQSLPQFYEKILIKVDQKGLPSIGELKQEAPFAIAVESNEINPSDFLETDAKQPKALQFLISIEKFNINPGSQESINFLESLYACEEGDVFRTPVIRHILRIKWNRVQTFLMLKFILFVVLLAMISLHAIQDKLSSIEFIAILVINSLDFVITILESSIGFTWYITDVWNVIEIVRIVVMYSYLYFYYYNFPNAELMMWLQSLIILVTWSKSVSYFRLFDRTRYLIRIIVETFKEILAFFLILIVATVSFTFVFYISQNRQQSFYNCFIITYLWNFGQFEPNNENLLEIGIFLTASVMCPLLLMNLLIAMLGDSYDRIQEGMAIADGKEMVSMLLNIEALLVWKRQQNKAEFIQVCDDEKYVGKDGKQQWEGKIRSVKRLTKRLEKKITKQNHMAKSNQAIIMTGMKELKKEIMNEIKKIR